MISSARSACTWRPSPNTVPDAGFIASRNFDGPMSVAAVTPGSDAEHAGLQVGDTIIEFQGKPAGQESRQELVRIESRRHARSEGSIPPRQLSANSSGRSAAVRKSRTK